MNHDRAAKSSEQESFGRFVALKRAVSLGDLDRCLELEGGLRGHGKYGSAAFQLVQKAFLSKAVAATRRIEEDLRVIKCSGCGTAYALAPKAECNCKLCQAQVIRKT